jgi:hypothetical protein
VELEPIVESGLLAAAVKGIVNLWRRLRRRSESEVTTLRMDTPQGSNLTIIVIAPRSEPHVAVVTEPRDGSEDQKDPD